LAVKWFLIVYFLTMGTDGNMAWRTAEELGREGWYRMEHPDAQSCVEAQNRFTENFPRTDLVRAACEPLY
jgi:hypothetical protein